MDILLWIFSSFPGQLIDQFLAQARVMLEEELSFSDLETAVVAIEVPQLLQLLVVQHIQGVPKRCQGEYLL